nr:hypothetical protein [uncultured Nitrososphaera sp.]
MGRQAASKILGVGTYSNSTTTSARRWITELRTKIAAGTTVVQFTQGQTLLASIENIQIQPIPSFAKVKASASFIYVPSLTAANTIGTGTFTIREQTKTINRAMRLHVLVIGPPDPLRSGA